MPVAPRLHCACMALVLAYVTTAGAFYVSWPLADMHQELRSVAVGIRPSAGEWPTCYGQQSPREGRARSCVLMAVPRPDRSQSHKVKSGGREREGRQMWTQKRNTAPVEVSVEPQGGIVTQLETEEEAPAKGGKLQALVKAYGPVAGLVYLTVYIMTLGVFFAAVEAHLTPFGEEYDVPHLLEKVVHLLEPVTWAAPVVNLIHSNAHFGNFMCAWALTKLTEPARFVLTLTIVPQVAKYVRRKDR